ncbi:hypothetical protein J6590_068627 [Homalodisca vitripennis]|nr:hypothetical protein J6590_068627 [Homalodisca vitripennis]
MLITVAVWTSCLGLGTSVHDNSILTFPSLYIYETIIYARFHCANAVDGAAIHDHNTRARVDLRQTQHRSVLAVHPFLLQHLVSDAVSDLTPEFWSHVRLKKVGVEEAQNKPLRRFDIRETYK